MKKSKGKIGILNSGGDASGLNAVIASVVKTAENSGYECIGFIKGFEGILDPISYINLSSESVREITGKGGTILKSVNKGRFPAKIGDDQLNEIGKQVLSKAKKNLNDLGVETLIVIGGDGTLSAAMQLVDYGINIVGVPKTIDNDLLVTDRTFGFSSAISVVVEAIDRLKTTAASHDRIFFVETMGRGSGWIALYSGVAAEADMILLPEFNFTYENIIETLKKNREHGKNYQIVVVAEGSKINGEKVFKSKLKTQASLFGGISDQILQVVSRELGDDFEMRNIVLGHIQRGGAPNAEDRILAQRFGEAAVQAVINKQFGKMVALKGDEIVLEDIRSAVDHIKSVTDDHYLVKTARNMGISFGD